MPLFHSPAWTDVVFWALDLETSGLDPGAADILSVGMVPIRRGTIRWGERYYSLVRPTPGREPSAEAMRVHHILPAEVESARDLAEVYDEIATRLTEGVLLLHYARLDVAFLRDAATRLGRPRFRPTVVDTVRLLSRVGHRRRQLEPFADAPSTGLAAARAEAGLPPHLVHHALYDALATAELFLALRARLGATTLRRIR